MVRRRRGKSADDEQPAPLAPASASNFTQETSRLSSLEKRQTFDTALRALIPLINTHTEEATRQNLAVQVLVDVSRKSNLNLSHVDQRHFISQLLDEAEKELHKKSASSNQKIDAALAETYPLVMDEIDIKAASLLSKDELYNQLKPLISKLLNERKYQLNHLEQEHLQEKMINDMIALGPLETLLSDDSITDILVNNAQQVYVERNGKLELEDLQFRSDSHLMHIITRIVSGVGRRIDETTPYVDARLKDGSRVNAIIPPLSLQGPCLSIRKFNKLNITLDRMAEQNNLSVEMADLLRIATQSRLNIIISGGTGSGKTTLLNALSQMINPSERILTIEDSAELQLMQPHVVRLETRPSNVEGKGAIAERDLLKNALRMRPDRILLGEIRGSEAFDLLQAMNTGHDGTLCTIHASSPREAPPRLENMVMMAGFELPSKAIKIQIANSIDLIVQISRMRDGKRRITHITEILDIQADIITTQDLFEYKLESEDEDGNLIGSFVNSGIKPRFSHKAGHYGLTEQLNRLYQGE